MKVLGVDLGSFSIKVAELDVSSSGKAYSLAAFHEFPLSQDPNRDRGLEIIEALRNLSSQYSDADTKWVIGVPQNRVSVHHKRFPFRERPKILKSLAFELEDEIPLDIDETIFEAKIVEYVGAAADILTIASPKEAIEEMLAVAKDGGFDPDVVSVEGLALANLFEDWHSPPPEIPPTFRQAEDVTSIGITVTQKSRLILQIGHMRSNLLVYREGGLVAIRSILWGGADIAEELAKAFNLPMFEAIKVLQTKSFVLMNSAGASRDQILMSKTVTTAVDNLMRELRLTLLEVKSAFNIDYQQLDLVGGVAQIQNLGAYVTQALEIPANVVHPTQNLRQVRFEMTPHIDAVAPVAIGLAIEALKRPRNPAVNLRKGEYARENESLRIFWETWRVPAQVVLTMFVLFCIYSVTRDTLATGLVDSVDTRIEEVAKSEAKLKGSAASDTGLRTYLSKQKKIIRDRGALEQAERVNSAMDILAKLSEKLPVEKPPKPGLGINVTRLNIENEDVVIEGRVLNPSAVPQIDRALAELARPKSVQKAPTNGIPAGPGTPFAYRLKVNRKL